jgi:hypothetical protein
MTSKYNELITLFPFKKSEPLSEWTKRVALKSNVTVRTIQRYIKEAREQMEEEKLAKQFENSVLSPAEEKQLAVSTRFVQPVNLSNKPVSYTITTTANVPEQYINLGKIKEQTDNNSINHPHAGNHILLGCIHIPAENSYLIQAISNLMKDMGDSLAGVHYMGDIHDNTAFSRHQLNEVHSEGTSIVSEYSAVNSILDFFQHSCAREAKDMYITWLNGNHGDFYDRYFKDINTNKLMGITSSPSQAFSLEERGIHFNPGTSWKEDYHMLGDLQLHHGFLLGQNPCKAHLDKLQANNAFVHTHRVGSYFANGLASYNLGCLVNVESSHMKYASRVERANWENGFGVCSVDNQGKHHMTVVRCSSTGFYFGGKYYGK